MEVVEFMGMPKAGKSTQVELTETFLKHQKKARIRNIYEGARICPLDKSERFLYNAWSFHSTVNKLIEARISNFDYILLDRGVYDHIAFTHALYRSEQINEKQFEAQVKYFQEFTSLEDFVLVFMLEPEEVINRENKYYQLTGRVINLDFLTRLHNAYTEIILGIEKRLCLIDGSRPLENNIEEVLDFLVPSC